MARRLVGALAAIAASVAPVGPAGSPAGAQTGYPPGPCAVSVNVSAMGTVTVGAVIDVVLRPVCSWTPGLPVTVTVNGQVVATKPAALDGTVSINVTVLSTTLLSIDDPVLVPANCGNNMVTGVGGSSVASGMVTQSVGFTLDCARVLSATQSGTLAFTGAGLLRLTGIALAVALAGVLIAVAVRRRRIA